MSELRPAKADTYHDARDDGVIVLSPAEIEAYAEVLRRPLAECTRQAGCPVHGDVRDCPADEEGDQ